MKIQFGSTRGVGAELDGNKRQDLARVQPHELAKWLQARGRTVTQDWECFHPYSAEVTAEDVAELERLIGGAVPAAPTKPGRVCRRCHRNDQRDGVMFTTNPASGVCDDCQ